MTKTISGDVSLGVSLETKSVKQSLQSIRKAVYECFGGTDAKGLEKQIKSTNKEIEKQEKNIERIKQKLEDLNSSSETPKSVSSMEKELKNLEKELIKVDTEFNKLSDEQGGLAAHKVDGLSIEQSLSTEQYSRFQELDNLIIQNGEHTSELQSRISELKTKISQLKGNPNLTDEGKKYNAELKKATSELEKQKDKLAELEKQQKNTHNSSTRLGKSVGDFGKRINSLVKSALVFSVITKGLTILRQAFGKALMSNKQFASSVAQIKGNLLTAFMPIYQIVLPALQSLMNMLAKVTAYIAAFINLLTGKSVDASKKAAQALQTQAKAASNAGGAAKEAADDTEKSSLAFDELNTISSGADTSSDSGGGSADSSAASPFETTDVAITDEIQGRLQAILTLVGTIGTALGAWKLFEFIKSLFTINEETGKLTETALKNRDLLKKISGVAMIIAGAILLVKDYSDAWINGIDWKNFAGIIGGLALVIGGIALAISPAAAAFALIGGGIALVILGIKDFVTNGYSMQNVLMILAGAIAVVIGAVWAFNSSLLASPVTWIVIGIMALVAAFVILWNECEGFRNFWIELWNNIKEGAMWCWEEGLKPALEWIGEKFQWLWNQILAPFIDFVKNIFTGDWNSAFASITQVVNGVSNLIGAIFGEGYGDSVRTVLNGFIKFIKGVFTGNWKMAWEGIKDVFKGIINGIITHFESMVNFIIRGINKLIEGLDGLVNKAGSVIGLDIHIPQIPEISLPRLARGAVIPPNKEFLAVLGDQKHGTNIEAPASLIKQMVNEALEERGYSDNQTININFTGNLAQLARVLKPQLDKETTRKGTKLVTGGAY